MSWLISLIWFGDGLIWYYFYQMHKKSSMERWERGIGDMPDLPKLKSRYILSWVLVQAVKWGLLLSAFSEFPAQR